MAKGTLHGQKPQGCLRLLLKLPRWLYWAGLGWLLGWRFLMFRHVGRKTGETHETVVEVLHHDREVDRYLVASGWGEQADWYRNIMATPEVQVLTGRRSFDAVARRLPEDAAARALCAYAARHPVAFRTLSRMMVGESLDPKASGCRDLARRVPVVAFGVPLDNLALGIGVGTALGVTIGAILDERRAAEVDAEAASPEDPT